MKIQIENCNLSPEAREALEAYLAKREERSLKIGVGVVLGAVALIGGFSLFLIEQAQTYATNEARDIIANEFEPVFQDQRDEFAEFRIELNSLKNDAEYASRNVQIFEARLREIETDASSAIEGLKKAEKSALFAHEVVDLWTKINEMNLRTSPLAQINQDAATVGELQP